MTTESAMAELMNKTGLKSRELARALRFPENAISYYLNGKRKPNLLNCYRIMAFAKKHNIVITLEDLLPNESN